MTIIILTSFVDRDSSTGELTSYAQGDIVSNLSDEVANAFINVGLAKLRDFPNFKNLVDRSITSVTADMLAGVTTIGGSAFIGCQSLTSVVTPNSVNEIGSNAFYNCASLVSATFQATTPPTLGSDAFHGVSNDLVIYVPTESVDTYKAASGWSSYASKIQAIPAED